LRRDKRVCCPKDLLKRICALHDFTETRRNSVLASCQVWILGLDRALKVLEAVRIELDGAAGIIILQSNDPKVLIWVQRLVGIELSLGKEQNAAAPVQIVLIEAVVTRGNAASALVVGQ
jgi:hypothetical protein